MGEHEAPKEANYEVERVAAWVRRNDFQRVAVQFPDELLADAPLMVSRLTRKLPGRKIFILGDSTYGSSSVDEVHAEHHCADCIVHIGPSDQQHVGSMPVLFVFGREVLEEAALLQSVEGVVAELLEHFHGEVPCSLVLLGEVALHHALLRIAPAILTALGHRVDLFVAVPHDSGGSDSDGTLNLSAWRDLRFGIAPLATAWWACLGPLARAVASNREPLRVCGRTLAGVCDRHGGAEIAAPLTSWPDRCGLVYVGASGSALERRIVMRHGYARPCWRLEPCGGPMVRLSSDSFLLQRYRYIELAKSVDTVGLLLSTSAAELTKAAADRLEALLHRAGRRSYRFIVGRLTPEKLGNFPEVNCYVSLAGPEHFPFNTKEFMVPIVSPYELEVALGVREWTGSYITDLDELLLSPLPQGPLAEDVMEVQMLGAGGRIRHFAAAPSAVVAPVVPGFDVQASAGPARLTEGLYGVAGKYVSEPVNRGAAEPSR